MIGKKGEVSPAVWLMAFLLIAIVGIIGIFAWQQMQLALVRPVPIEYEGEWDKIYAPDEVSGTDLTITETDITDGATLRRVANVSYDLNGTDGQTAYLAFGVEVSGSNGFEKIDIDGALASPTTTTELEIRKAYILEDKEGVNLDVADAKWTGTVSTDQDEFDIDVGPVPEGDYVFAVEVKGITTSGIAADDALLKIDFDATTDDDVDDFTLYIHNA